MKGLSWSYTLVSGLLVLCMVSFAHARSISQSEKPQIALKPRVAALKTTGVKISQEADISRIIVKFKEKTDIRLRAGRMTSLKGRDIGELNRILNPYLSGRLARLLNKPENDIKTFKETFEVSSGIELADFNLYYTINVTEPSEAELIINQLNGLDVVEIAYIEPHAVPAGDIDPPTPDFELFQTYLLPAPDGVDAGYANALTGGDGAGVKIVDIENGWNENHEDLDKAVGGTINGGNDPNGNHGTAVLGEMIAGDNGYGATGICPGADVGMASAAVNGTTNAMFMAIDNLERGDLMLIELHSPGPRYDFQIRSDQLGYVCMEYWQDKFDALQYAWAKGIIVIEAAGNGAENFDDAIYGQLFDTTYRNSHAIIAGAGAPPSGNSGPPRSRLGFSNNGERVNLQGDGLEVFTTGYGGHFDGGGDPNQYYTSSFSGTSSASPIVTGAIACLQGYYMANFGVPLTSDYARDVLVATGTAQQGDTTGQHIGPMPNLAAAIPALAPPPSLYTEPILVDTTVDQGTISTVDVWIYNRSASIPVDFLITESDNLPLDDPDWLRISPGSGSVPVSDSVLMTVTLDASVIDDQLDIYKGIIQINWGTLEKSLDSIAYVPVFLSVPCMADTTYEIISSDEPEGPQYEWIDITTIGSEIPEGSYYNSNAGSPNDDGTAGPFGLPFLFPFYDTTYNNFYVGVNGGISFTNSEVNDGGYFSGLDIPGNPFATFVAVFWNDLIVGSVGHAAHGGIYTYFSTSSDTAIIEWYQVGNFNSPADTLTTFEVILTKQGDIVMQYFDIGITGMENTALIGINAFECNASPYFIHGDPAENTVSSGEAVLFDGAFALPPVMAGDANADGNINILDITFLINYLYMNGPAPDPPESGDVNCSGTTNILDITYLIAYLYNNGPPPCFYQP